MAVQTGNVASNFIYVDNDKPLYKKGNAALLAINILGILLFGLTKLYYMWRNRQRERIWNAMSEDEKADYIATTRVFGSARLDFRFAH